MELTPEAIGTLIATSVVGFVLYLVTQFFVTLPGNLLGNKFRSLGVIRGKHINDIVRVVGSPTSVSWNGDEQVMQWMATGYHIVLVFQNDICQGVTHEFSQAPGAAPSLPPPVTAQIAPPPIPTPTPMPQGDEDEAKRCFMQAKEFLKGGQKELTIQVLSDIVRRFPESKYADSARKSLGLDPKSK